MFLKTAAELEIEEKRKQNELKMAEWRGVKARQAGDMECPYVMNKEDMLTHASMLWCRWYVGWIREDERLRMSQSAINDLVEKLNVSQESQNDPYEGIEFRQDDYDDGIQTLFITQGEESWEERRFYPHDTPNFEVVQKLMDANVDRSVIYQIILKLSEEEFTTRGKAAVGGDAS